MNVSDFDYDLPQELIAQTPLLNRSASRLMILNRKTGEIAHRHFFDIADYLFKGDVLVINDTRVMPSRIHGIKVETNAKIELLLLRETEKDVYECLVRPARRVKDKTVISFAPDCTGEVIEKEENGICLVKFTTAGPFMDKLMQIGEVPLPPYIHKKLKDPSRYQTIYATNLGSAAAPTAGLHFTEELIDKIKAKGVEIERVTLNIGIDTFRPVNEEKVEEHQMHREFVMMNKDVAERLNTAKEEGRRIVAVGTTSVRLLEAVYHKYGKFTACHEDTGIFIYPGFTFMAVDALITNFHLPKSTLIMLVSAFAGRENILNAYKIAVKERYRFFSFGDAMFIQ